MWVATKVRRVVREELLFNKPAVAVPAPTPPTARSSNVGSTQWSTDEQAIAYDRRSDGMYPLMTNDRKLSAAQVLQAHKASP